MMPLTDYQREIPPELSGDCVLSLAFRTDPGWKQVAGSHQGWGDENFQVQPKIDVAAPVDLCGRTAGCLKVPFIDENGNHAWVRFVLADESLHQETAASRGQPRLTDD